MDDVEDIGKNYAAGAHISSTISGTVVPIDPCESPVEWLVGYHNNVASFGEGMQPEWAMDGKYSSSNSYIWTSTQSQATIQFVVSDAHPDPGKITMERSTNRSDLNYSAPCIKGLWTGDYFEFKIPVKNFSANTDVTLTMPVFGRGNPIFWNVEYLDGKEWKCNKSNHKSTDNKYEMECTWAIPHGNINGNFVGHIMTHTMTFEKAISSGYIRIRMTCASGSYITMNGTSDISNCVMIEGPFSYTGADPLMAFVNQTAVCKAISITWGDEE